MLINPPAFPKMWWADILSAQVLVGSGFTYTLAATEFYNWFVYQTTPADGNSFGWYAYLQAGTYKMGVWHNKDNNVGIQDFKVGTILAGTLDGYAALAARNQLATFTNIIIPESGNYLITATINGKNAASSDFYGETKMVYLTQ